MAGGTSGKSTTLYMVALARMDEARKAIQQLSQHGGLVGDPRHGISDPAIIAAIAALAALQ